jgi:hypothetical protein
MGTVAGIGAYLRLSCGRWPAASLRYAPVNVVAGVLAVSASAMHGAWPGAATNFVWTCIGLHSAITTVRARRLHGLDLGRPLQAADNRANQPAGAPPLLMDA